jgi:hypothetical protein
MSSENRKVGRFNRLGTAQACICGNFLARSKMRPIGGSIIRIVVSKETFSGERAVLAILSPVRLNSVSWENGDRLARDRFECDD